MVADHRHQRDDPGTPRDQQQRPIFACGPDKVPANRPAKLDPIPHSDLADEIRRYLAVAQPLDCQRDPRIFWWGGYRVAALSLVAIFGGKADVDVLPCEVAGPVGDVEDDAGHRWRLPDQLGHLAE